MLVADERRRALAFDGGGTAGARGAQRVSAVGLPAALREIAQLRAALRPLDAFPSDVGWNRGELADLLLPATELADAAVLVGLVARASGTAVDRKSKRLNSSH